MILKRGAVRVALALLVAAPGVASACTPVAGAPGLPGGVYGRSAGVVGEVRAVDRRRARIWLSVEHGRVRAVNYGRRTRVYIGRRAYPVAALRRGDDVWVRLVYDRRGRAWAERVVLRRGDRDWRDRDRWGDDDRWEDDDRWDGDRWGDDDRHRAVWRVARWAGRVQVVDVRRRYFTLDRGLSRVVVVRLPSRLDRADARRLGRLRRGERVVVEVRHRDGDVVELIRFR
ncbi:MAG TPA: hypothetical protein VF212_12060 [Longimicrobiales bacterium]